eukprot:scaffold20449_cov67-Phaeocystis_antarctica.AAC.2
MQPGQSSSRCAQPSRCARCGTPTTRSSMSVRPAANPNAGHPASHTPSHPASRTGTVSRTASCTTKPQRAVHESPMPPAAPPAAPPHTALSCVPSSHTYTCCAHDCVQTATT